MQRRKFIAGLGSLAAGGAAVMGTGATLNIAADGDAQLDVTGPADALLRVDPNTSSEFVSEGDPITIDLQSDTGNGGSGLQEQSNFIIEPAFTLDNQTDTDLFVQINNPLANNDITTSGSPGDKAVGGVDVQFLALPSAPVRDNPNVGLIGRNNLPASSLGGNFDEPGTNEFFPNQAIADPLNAGSRVPLTSDKSAAQAGYLEIAAGSSYDVVYHVAVRNPGNGTSLDADFAIKANDDESLMTFDNKVNDQFSSGGK